jgi:hypothetical protein
MQLWRHGCGIHVVTDWYRRCHSHWCVSRGRVMLHYAEQTATLEEHRLAARRYDVGATMMAPTSVVAVMAWPDDALCGAVTVVLPTRASAATL